MSYVRAAYHAVYVADRLGERLARIARAERWPYDPAEPADYLAESLYRCARQRLAIQRARLLPSAAVEGGTGNGVGGAASAGATAADGTLGGSGEAR